MCRSVKILAAFFTDILPKIRKYLIQDTYVSYKLHGEKLLTGIAVTYRKILHNKAHLLQLVAGS